MALKSRSRLCDRIWSLLLGIGTVDQHLAQTVEEAHLDPGVAALANHRLHGMTKGLTLSEHALGSL